MSAPRLFGGLAILLKALLGSEDTPAGPVVVGVVGDKDSVVNIELLSILSIAVANELLSSTENEEDIGPGSKLEQIPTTTTVDELGELTVPSKEVVLPRFVVI